MKTINIFLTTLLIIAISLSTTSCSKEDGCTDPIANNYNADAENEDGSCTYDTPVTTANITFTFTHNFDGLAVDSSTFHQFNYENLNGDTLSIELLRYLVSRFRLHKANGDSVLIDGYNLVDVKNATGMTYSTTIDVPFDTYSDISFNFGFNEDDNIDQAYPNLNIVNWNWPAMHGGGYHFMQMNGTYKEQGNDSLYGYHHGTATKSMGVFEQNHFKADLAGLTLSKANVNVEIQMNIAEWYNNPLWDLNQYHSMLMPNYTAQKMMQANGSSVFSLGNVTQTD